MSSRSTVITLFGSAWPIWIFATLFGVMATVLIRQLFIWLNLHRLLPLPALFYTAIWLILSIAIYNAWVRPY